ncbi:MAG: heparin lyase I family protein [Myxococcales bacterium]|jgi:MYXO-CTERM domain-containing protein
MKTSRTCVVAVAIAVSALVSGSASASVVWRGDFESGDLSQWSSKQSVSNDRLQVVSSPVAQGRYALKVTVRQGDDPINASGNRNELVYLTYEPSGTERWYRWQTMFPNDYPSANYWQLFTQFHHSGNTGSPPVEFGVIGETLGLQVRSSPVWTTPLKRGVWHDFVLHVKWSPSASEGFIELYYDGQLVLPKTMAATQFSGQSQYLKQGLYRHEAISAVGVVYHDGMIIGTTREDVMSNAPTEPTEPTNPTEPTDPTEPTNPTEPTDPTNPTEPTDPTNPTEPTDPTEPAEPTYPTEPTDPTEPAEPTNPTEPTDPTEPGQPNEPGNPNTDPGNVDEGSPEAPAKGDAAAGCSSAGSGQLGGLLMVLALGLPVASRRRRKQ